MQGVTSGASPTPECHRWHKPGTAEFSVLGHAIVSGFNTRSSKADPSCRFKTNPASYRVGLWVFSWSATVLQNVSPSPNLQRYREKILPYLLLQSFQVKIFTCFSGVHFFFKVRAWCDNFHTAIIYWNTGPAALGTLVGAGSLKPPLFRWISIGMPLFLFVFGTAALGRGHTRYGLLPSAAGPWVDLGFCTGSEDPGLAGPARTPWGQARAALTAPAPPARSAPLGAVPAARRRLPIGPRAARRRLSIGPRALATATDISCRALIGCRLPPSHSNSGARGGGRGRGSGGSPEGRGPRRGRALWKPFSGPRHRRFCGPRWNGDGTRSGASQRRGSVQRQQPRSKIPTGSCWAAVWGPK